MISGPGSFVVLVGPDGVGKTSVALALWERGNVRYFHFRPSLTGPWGVPSPGETLAKDVRTASVGSSVVRLFLNVLRFWVAYLVRVRPALRSGQIVVGDRWAFGYVAKPRELRYFGPSRLARAALAVLPQPDAVVCLVAPVDVVRSRKAELSSEAIERDIEAWRSVPARNVIEIDATLSPEEIADRIVAALTPGDAAGLH